MKSTSITLSAGDKVLVGDRLVAVTNELASAFRPGDSIIGVPGSDVLLHVPSAENAVAHDAVSRAVEAFALMARVEQSQVTNFYRSFAAALEDDEIFGRIVRANAEDVRSAESRGRPTGRLLISDSMRADMIAGLMMWAESESTIDHIEAYVQRDGLEVELVRAPLGPVAFIFEGRPNVFADATGVLRSGNTVVFRIGSDALRTAEAIMEFAVRPALREAGLPEGAVSLVRSREHAAGWALFSDQRLALAVARGSGGAVAQLGAIARQAGIPVSLHGTGGAWLIVAPSADLERVYATVRWSLDRKVCNTLNVLCLTSEHLANSAPVVARAIGAAAQARDQNGIVHLVGDVSELNNALTSAGIDVRPAEQHELAREWEWDNEPELAIVVVDSVEEAIGLFNTHAPRFIVSVLSEDAGDHDSVWRECDAPFVGDGFTRWVDGQFALNKPELGLSNWEHGRILARPGVLSGDSVYSVRVRARQTDANLHR